MLHLHMMLKPHPNHPGPSSPRSQVQFPWHWSLRSATSSASFWRAGRGAQLIESVEGLNPSVSLQLNAQACAYIIINVSTPGAPRCNICDILWLHTVAILYIQVKCQPKFAHKFKSGDFWLDATFSRLLRKHWMFEVSWPKVFIKELEDRAPAAGRCGISPTQKRRELSERKRTRACRTQVDTSVVSTRNPSTGWLIYKSSYSNL